MKYCTSLLVGFFLFSTLGVEAQSPDLETRAFCFEEIVQEALGGQPHFRKLLRTLRVGRYEDMDEKLGAPFSMAVAPGLELGSPLIKQRFYAWGAQISYVPLEGSVFPADQDSEKISEGIKKGMFVEEYVQGDSDDIFIGCGFVYVDHVGGSNFGQRDILSTELLRSVKAEKDAYKTWYGDYVMRDYEGKVRALQKNLFMYPASTQNNYFDRYQVLDYFPSVEMGVFGDLEDLKVLAAAGNFPKAQKRKGLFTSEGYYKGIESVFPVFASNLSIKGWLSYENLKKFMKNPRNPEWSLIRSVVFDSESFLQYYHDKMQGGVVEEREDYERVLANRDIFNDLFVVPEVVLEVTKTGSKKVAEIKTNKEDRAYLILGGIVGLLLLLAFIRYYRNRKS